jgi:hypothetical protein
MSLQAALGESEALPKDSTAKAGETPVPEPTLESAIDQCALLPKEEKIIKEELDKQKQESK